MRTLALIALLAPSADAAAGPDLTEAQLKEAAERFAHCAGVWRTMAAVDERAGKPASAEQWRGIERGALFAAQWSFSHRWIKQHPGQPPKPYGAFGQRAEELAQLGATRFLATFEGEGPQAIAERMQECANTREAQQSIIDQMRDDATD